MPTAPTSPCVDVCKLLPEGFCAGCFRHIDEIAQWTVLSAERQWEIVRDLERRKAVLSSRCGGTPPDGKAVDKLRNEIEV